MEKLYFWVAGSFAVGAIAATRQRNGFGWFFASLVLSPVITFAALMALGPLVSPTTHRQCPACRETIRIDASRCKHCGTESPAEAEAPMA